MNKIEIKYCSKCRWLLRSSWMAQEILSTFEEEVDEKHSVKGIEAKERTFLNQINQRKILQNLSKTSMKINDLKDTISKMRKFKISPNANLVLGLL